MFFFFFSSYNLLCFSQLETKISVPMPDWTFASLALGILLLQDKRENRPNWISFFHMLQSFFSLLLKAPHFRHQVNL